MRELAIVLGVTAVMCLVSGIWFIPWESLYHGGIWVTLIGFVVGVPSGLMYHVRLYQTLDPRGELPPGWFWRPIRYNACLREEERAGVMLWCYIGGAGFAIICLGLLLMAAALGDMLQS